MYLTLEAKLGDDPLRFYDTFTVFIPGDLLTCFQNIHILCNAFVRLETISICIHSKNFVTLTCELGTCFRRCIYYQAKCMGKWDVILSVHPCLTHFMSLISFCAPWKREKGKRCYFNFSTNIMNVCYWRWLDVLTHLEWLGDVELVLFKFNFATKYKMLHSKGHGIYFLNLIKSNFLHFSKQ